MMTTNEGKPMYEFDMRVVAKDLSGYYYARWDRAQKVTVRGTTRDEAYQKAFDLMGECPTRGWGWSAKCDNVREVSV